MRPLVLIADDDAFIREVFREMLSAYDVVEAENGARAVDLYREKRPDLVLMDILMPEKDGIQATADIVKEDPEAKVIGVSAFASVKGEDMRKAGAREVMSKPVRMSEMMATVRSYIGE